VERIIRIQLERLPEGVYLATSDDVQGLVAQGRTVTGTLEIAPDVARKLLESQASPDAPGEEIAQQFSDPLVVGA